MTPQVFVLLPGVVLLGCAWSSAVSIPSELSSLTIKEQTTDQILGNLECREEKCKANPNEYFCGSDGKNYRSYCDLKNALCRGKKVTEVHPGSCAITEMCRLERNYNLNLRDGGKTFIPECREDGTYKAVQCHKGLNMCWCSRRDGSFIANSYRDGVVPVCPDEDRASVVPAKTEKKEPECVGDDRKMFNKNIISTFRDEYNRLPASEKNEVTSDEMINVLRWKFSDLDKKRKDGVLRKLEYKRLVLAGQKFLKPESCALAFPHFCDLDANKKLSHIEWMQCFYTTTLIRIDDSGSGGAKTLDARRHQQGKEKRTNCLRERAVEQEKSSSNNITNYYIPECDKKRFRAKQCIESKGYCWCVDVRTGKMREGSGVYNAEPDCFKKIWPGCAEVDKEIEFRNELMAHFKHFVANKQTKTKKRKQIRTQDLPPSRRERLSRDLPPSRRERLSRDLPQSKRERLSRKVFRRLDLNGNRKIDKKEKKLLRKLIKRNKKLQKCGRNIHLVCDFDGNNRISMSEWVLCVAERTEVPPKSVSSSTPQPLKTPRKNPFEDILISADKERSPSCSLPPFLCH